MSPCTTALLCIVIFSLIYLCSAASKKKEQVAIVTLVTGGDEVDGYVSGAMALGQSIADQHKSHKKYIVDRVAMITSDVNEGHRKTLSKLWKVKVVQDYYCNYNPQGLSKDKYDLENEKYKRGIKRWSRTCNHTTFGYL